MELDHNSGRMEGRCLKGQFAGRTLSSLREGELRQLLEELRATDPQGAFLIKIHLDWRSQDWGGRHPESPRATRPAVVSIPALLVVAAFLFLIFYHRVGVRIGPWFGSKGPFGTSRKSPGQKSQIRTRALEMELDHDSGHMEGRCLKGQFAGRALSSLSDGELLQLLEELRVRDSQGALLIEAYFDRRSKDWRNRHSDEGERDEPRQPRGRMTVNEAHDVLGLKGGASKEEIRAAHRRLIMKLHPDQGGSTYLAARINESKEILLGQK
jgi:DnaJ-like protein